MEFIRELNERKLKILKAVIQNYLETGEPVGSRTISKYTDLNLSSATIRNEMADLEELGYIVQPHTSAGRIPSDKGYRLYVDMLMQDKEQEVTEIKEQMLEKADKMDQLLKAGGESAGKQYEFMLPWVYSPGQREEPAEVHSALSGRRRAVDCGDCSGRQYCEEPDLKGGRGA